MGEKIRGAIRTVRQNGLLLRNRAMAIGSSLEGALPAAVFIEGDPAKAAALAAGIVGLEGLRNAARSVRRKSEFPVASTVARLVEGSMPITLMLTHQDPRLVVGSLVGIGFSEGVARWRRLRDDGKLAVVDPTK